MKKFILPLIISLFFAFTLGAKTLLLVNYTKKDGITIKLKKSGDGSIKKKGRVTKKATRPPVKKVALMFATVDAGRTVGSLDVSGSGAATYTIPIAVPPGINGVVPKVTLSYSSQGGNGVAGYGWNIGGLSSITRIARTKFHDGVIGDVKIDLNDRFALDGQRLILKSGTYGTDGAVYQTENYSNLKVVSKGSLGTGLGPAYFEVYYPDGSHAVYGQDNTSISPGTYAINYIDNPQGIRISYVYDNSYGNIVKITDIKYGSKSTATPINTIHFEYKSRTRAEQGYVAGQSTYQSELLDYIAVSGNGTPYRQYNLTHNVVQYLNYERLESVQELSGDLSKSFEPIIFTYTNISLSPPVPATSHSLNTNGINATDHKVVTSDFNGNGIIDFILYSNSKDYLSLGFDIGHGGQLHGQSVSTFEEAFAVQELDVNNRLLSTKGLTLVHSGGAGTKNFSTYVPTSNSITYSDSKSWDTAPVKPNYYSGCTNDTVQGGAVPLNYYSGDFNGDGLTDVIAVTPNYSYGISAANYPGDGCVIQSNWVYTPTAYFINLDRRVTTDFVKELGDLFRPFATWDNANIYTGDFNGNGKTDILQVYSGSMRVYELDENNDLQLLWSKTDGNVWLGTTLLGDYNGDGKTDVMFPTGTAYPNDAKFAVFTSNGKDFVKELKDYPFTYQVGHWLSNPARYMNHILIPNDVNGDGKTDMIKLNTLSSSNSTTGWAQVAVYNNTGPGSGTGAPEFGWSVEGQGGDLNITHTPIPVFLTSTQEPNFSSEFALLSDDSMTLYHHRKDLQKEAVITKISQDGVDLEIEYKKLVPGTSSGPLSFYQKFDAHDQVYPYVDIDELPGTYAVSKLTREYNSNKLYQYFGYRGAVSNVEGLGFIGFNESYRTSWVTGATDNNRVITTNVFDPQLRGAMVRSFTSKNPFTNSSTIKNKAGTTADIVLETPVLAAQTVIASHSIRLKPGFSANGANGTFIAKLDDPATGINDGGSAVSDYITRTDYTYKTELDPSSKVFVSVPLSQATKDLLNNTNTLVTYSYDEYYNTTKTETNLSGAGTKTSVITYDNNPSGGYFGRITNKIETATNGGDSFSTEEQYTYNGFLPTQIKKRGNGTPFITENYTYDTYGNVLSKQLVTTDGTRTTSMTYDASGRFVNTSTDIEGLVNTMAYNTSTGNLNSTTNPYGQTATYDYDVWGRSIKTIDHLNKSSYTTYNHSGTYDMEVVETDDEGRSKITTTNAIGKTKSVIVKDVLGQDVEKAFDYDIYDRQIGESEPGIGGVTQWNLTEYDEYGRPKKLTAFTGKIATISYNGLSTTTYDGTKTTVTTKNALGHVISTQDPGGTIYNTYYANGKLKSATFDGSTQTMEQDGWGRKTKLTDPSAGIYTYTYNQFGETLTETTPKGTTTYTYDSNGKVQTKQITGDNTNMAYGYTYNGTTKLLTSATLTNADGNNTTYSYTYDGDKRLISTIEDNLHAVFTKTLTYDSYGRVNTETSEAKNKRNNIPISKTIQNIYQNGELKEITDYVLGNSIWKVTALNARGQVTTALLGTALRDTKVYNSYGYAENFKTENITGTPVMLMELGFVFDQTRGNLTSRTNSVFSWSETFTYDNQDRLITYNDNTGNHSQTYDNRGRVTNNSQVGDYSYTGTSYQQNKLTNLTAFSKYHYQNRTPQQISYNALKKPVSINETGKERIDFQYNGDQQRAHMYYGSTDATKENRPKQRHYSEDGSMEITEDFTTGETSFVFYLGGDAYEASAIWKHKHTSSTSTGALYYLHRDYLGSILLITDAGGAVQEKRHFDAWGNIVKLQDGSGNDLTEFKILDRGYTGHEHLLGVGLINMNGRLYDPILHRFLSPDNFVQDPSNTQNFNRYGYVLNNPLKFKDANGEFFNLIFGAVIGVVTNGISNLFHGKNFFDGAGQAALMGAVSAGFASGIGTVAAGIGKGAFSIGRAAFQMGAHGLLGGYMSAMNGQSFLSGFASSALSSVVSSGTGFLLRNASVGIQQASLYVTGTLSGGLGASLSGGSFWDGARNGAITAGLNHAAHLFLDDPGPKKLSKAQAEAKKWAKYGKIIGVQSVSLQGGFAIGRMKEYGIVTTDKGWNQMYETTYTFEGYSFGGGGGFNLGVISSNNATIGDWRGSYIGLSLSYKYGTVFAGGTNTYKVYGLGLGYSVNAPQTGNVSGHLAWGNTVLKGEPYYTRPFAYGQSAFSNSYFSSLYQ